MRIVKSNPLLFIVFAAVFIKVLVLFVILPVVSQGFGSVHGLETPFRDGYDLIANNLITGHGYRFFPGMAETMMREPGYPLFLAGVFKLLGYSIEAARLANLFISTISSLLLIRLSQYLSKDQLVPALAVLFYMFNPGIMVAEARGGIEILFIFLLLFFFLALYRAIDRGFGSDYFFSGLIFGITSLVRSSILLYPLILYTFLVLRGKNTTTKKVIILKNILAMTIAFTLIITPWIARNYIITRQFIPTASVQGLTLQEGMYTCQQSLQNREFGIAQMEAGKIRSSIATELGLPFRSPGNYYQYFFHPGDEILFSKSLQNLAITTYKQKPFLLFQCASRNLFNFWFLGKNKFATQLNFIAQVPLLILSIMGSLILWRRKIIFAIPIILFILYFYFIHLFIISQARYSVPLVPFMSMFSAISVALFWKSSKSRSASV